MEDNVHSIEVYLHPVAAFAIIDSHERRSKDNQTRVIGSLLGTKTPDGVYEISSAYPVPHSESEDEVAIDMKYEQSMYQLYKTINPTDVVLGWYATNSTIKMHSVLIHDYYSKRDPPPVYLTFDCKMRSGRLDIKAYVRCSLGVETKGYIFSPIPIKMAYYDPERAAVNLLRQSISTDTNETPVKTGIQRFENVLGSLEASIDGLLAYVEKVKSGEIPADSKIGRLLMELVSKVPKLDPNQFDKIMNNTTQDLLMIVYLTNLTKTQLELGEQVAHIPSN